MIDYKNMNFRERMNLKAKFGRKKAKVEKLLKTVLKSGYNDQEEYYFPTKGDIVRELRPLLAQCGLTVTPTQKSMTHERDGRSSIVTVNMLFTVMDNETGYEEYPEFSGIGRDDGLGRNHTAIYAAYTGAHKYFLSVYFNVDIGDDPEGRELQQRKEEDKPPVAADVTTNPMDNERIEEIRNLVADYVLKYGGNEVGIMRMVCLSKKLGGTVKKLDLNKVDDITDSLTADVVLGALKELHKHKENVEEVPTPSEQKPDPFRRRKT